MEAHRRRSISLLPLIDRIVVLVIAPVCVRWSDQRMSSLGQRKLNLDAGGRQALNSDNVRARILSVLLGPGEL